MRRLTVASYPDCQSPVLGVGEGPDDAQAVRPVYAHVEAVLGAGVA